MKRKQYQSDMNHQLHLRMAPERLARLDEYRRKLADLPSRQEAINRLIDATAEDRP